MCNCVQPGYCPLHDIVKNRQLWEHCQNKQEIIVNGKQLTPPGLIKSIFNYGIALVRHTLNGSPQTPEPIQIARLDICKACTNYISEDGKCSECGCYVEEKVKWADSECPLKSPKWKAVVGVGKCSTCGKK
jgi:hypothetical protein